MDINPTNITIKLKQILRVPVNV